MKTKICSRCHKSLPITEFHIERQTPDGHHRHCKKCHVLTNKEYRHKNPELYRKIHRDYMRKYRIGCNGKDKWSVKNKRGYPLDEKCEICKEKVHLVYHHWDDSDFSKGIWICTKCHFASHWLEKYNPKLFYDLKTKINLLSNNEV